MKKGFIGLVLLLIFSVPSVWAEEPTYNLENVRGDVYRFSNGDVNGVLVETKKGVIVVDPGPEGLARWVLAETRARFQKPVTHVIYSNDNPQHFSGGKVFVDTAHYIVNRRAQAALDHLPQVEKIATALNLGNDYDIDGKKFRVLTAQTTRDMSIYFHKEKVLYLADLYHPTEMPEKVFHAASIRDHVVAMAGFNWMNFKVFVGGHGAPAEKDDLMAYQAFVMDTLKQVHKAKSENLSKQQAIEDVKVAFPGGRTANSERKESLVSHFFETLEGDPQFKSYMKSGLVFPLARSGMNIPEKLYKQKICGWVVLEYDVTAKGEAKKIRVLEESPKGIYTLISVESAKRYRYLPGFPGENIRTMVRYDFDEKCEFPESLSGETEVGIWEIVN